jgi:hypothetical protein
MFGLFRRSSDAERQQAGMVKARVRETLGLDEAVAVTVSEIECGDARCPGRETVILILRPKQPTAVVRIAAPLLSVTEAMVDGAVTAAPPPPPPRS